MEFPEKVFVVLWKDVHFHGKSEDMKIQAVTKIRVFDAKNMDALRRGEDIGIMTLKVPLIFSSKVYLKYVQK